jgi:hypothetical protein
MQSLNNIDKEKLFALLPASIKDKEKHMAQLLRGDKLG